MPAISQSPKSRSDSRLRGNDGQKRKRCLLVLNPKP
jgi:hypothetical protein